MRVLCVVHTLKVVDGHGFWWLCKPPPPLAPRARFDHRQAAQTLCANPSILLMLNMLYSLPNTPTSIATYNTFTASHGGLHTHTCTAVTDGWRYLLDRKLERHARHLLPSSHSSSLTTTCWRPKRGSWCAKMARLAAAPTRLAAAAAWPCSLCSSQPFSTCMIVCVSTFTTPPCLSCCCNLHVCSLSPGKRSPLAWNTVGNNTLFSPWNIGDNVQGVFQVNRIQPYSLLHCKLCFCRSTCSGKA